MSDSLSPNTRTQESRRLPFDDAVLTGSIIDRFEAVVAAFANEDALVGDQGPISYEDLNQRINRLAWTILNLNPPADVPVAVLLESGPDAVITLLAILKTGHFYTVLDNRAPKPRLDAILADAGAAIMITDKAHRDTIDSLENAAALTRLVIDEDELETQDENVNRPVKDMDLVGIYYTSGSTGEPKGILFDHLQVLLSIQTYAQQDQIGPGDRVGLVASLAFGASTVMLFSALLNGAALNVYRSPSGALEEMDTWLREGRITVMHPPIALFRSFVITRTPDDFYPDVRQVVLGGDVLFRDDIISARPHFPADCVFVNQLAAHESMVTARNRIEQDTPLTDSVLPVGVPVPGREFQLVDEDGKQVKPGEIGEIIIKGRGFTPGYWKQPELTATTFGRDADDERLRIWYSGDLGQFDREGNLTFKGRKDLAVKIRGYRVTVAEIELALRRYRGLSDAAVWVHGDHLGEKRLVAYYVPEEGETVMPADLRDWLGDMLPEYMIPSFFMQIDSLPMTITGKVDRKKLPAPDMSRPDLPTTFVGARDGLEQNLIYVWETVLGIRPVGVHDDFFDLGGHSLLALQLVTKIQEVLDTEFELDSLLETNTVAAMADMIRAGADPQQRRTIVTLKEGDDRLPLVLIHPRGGTLIAYNELLRHLDADLPVLGIQARGLQGEARPFDDIRQMAAWYVQQLQQDLPDGPYYLGGHSMGGLIAFEVAQQLEAAGLPVGLVVMFDTAYPKRRGGGTRHKKAREAYPGKSEARAPESLKVRLQRVLQDDRDELQTLTWGDRLSYITGRIGHFWNWYVIRLVFRARGKEAEFHERGWSPTRLAKTLHLRASHNYVAQGTLQARFVYLAAHEAKVSGSDELWSQHSAGSFEVFRRDTSHRGLLSMPEVAEVAEYINAVMDDLYSANKD